jgi:hypothetical protein
VQVRLFWLILIAGFAGVGWLAMNRDEVAGPAQGDSVEFRQLSAAVEKTSNLLGSRATMTASADIPAVGAQMQMSGTGLFNAKTNRSSMTMTGGVPGYPQASISVSAVSEDNRMYISSPQFAAGMPDGKSWMLMELPDMGQMNFDARSQLEQLERTSSEVDVAGRESVGGVLTTRYDGITDTDLTIEMLREEGNDEAADQIEALGEAMPGEMPFSVWIDRRNLVRRMTMEMPFDVVAGEGAAMTMTIEFSDFGIEPQIALPPESEVFDATDLGEQYLDQLMG